MKYLGNKSLSGFLSGLIHVLFYVFLAGAIITFVGGILVLFVPSIQNGISLAIESGIWGDANMADWQTFMNLHVAWKLLMIPYFAVFAWLLLKIMSMTRILFKNFRENTVFTEENTALIRLIAKRLIIFAIITFNLTSLILALLLLILAEIFKNGATLKEEQDLTV